MNQRKDNKPSGMRLTIVDTKDKVSDMIDTLFALPTDTPNIAVDLEGKCMGHSGHIHIITIHDCRHKWTYLVDVHILAVHALFHWGFKNNRVTLQTILESRTIPKLFWDIRNDSAALYQEFGVKVAGIIDVQLVYLASICQQRFQATRDGLDTVISREHGLMSKEKQFAWTEAKRFGPRLFEVSAFQQRPLSREAILYCAGDVVYLLKLYKKYSAKVSEAWKATVRKTTAAAIQESWQRVPCHSGGRLEWK